MKRSSAFVAALFATSALASPAFAQEYTPPSIPPIRETIDPNGVDLTRGAWVGQTHSVSIGGPGTAGMSWSRTLTASQGAWRDSTAIILTVSGSSYTVTAGGASESFTLTGSDYVSDQKTGSTLTLSGTTYTYTTSDGTIYKLDPYIGQKRQYRGNDRVSTITYPTGEVLTFNWETVDGICIPNIHAPDGCNRTDGDRLRSVTATNGYKLQFAFQTEDPSNAGPGAGWATITTVQAQNMSVDPASQSWPTLTFTGSQLVSPITITDSLSRTTTYTFGSSVLSSIKRSGASANNETFGYTGGLVTQVNKDGITTNYSYSTVGTVLTTTVTDAASHTRVVKTDTTTGLVSSDQDETGKITNYTYYSGNGLLNTVTAPLGKTATFTYDQRGNLTQTSLAPNTGSGLSAIVTSATYPPSDATKTWLCASGTPVVKCNKPTTTTDAKGNVTTYAWDSTTGLPTSVTRPAPTTGAVQPETRYSYSSVYAQYLSGGSLVNFATPVTRLTGISQCQTTSSCTGGSDEVKSSISYGTANALPVSTSSGAGDGSLTATSAFTYDTVGNRLTVDGPLSGTADTTRTRYDADREVVGVVDPDPDGAGALKNRAVRITYNADGQVTKTELGTVLSQSDPDWANFVTAQEVDTTYDSNARATQQKLVSGSTTYALTQANYDNMGRINCSAVRMNPAIYGSLPSDACTLGTTGSYGADRISQIIYDADSRPTQLKVAVGTSDAATERTLTYSDNGKVTSLKDGENNLTTYEYDGFDRLSKTRYPVTTKGGNASSTTDYEQLGYDANSNVISFRNRAGSSIGFTYDNLNRMTLKDLPSPESDVSYTYDLLDRNTGASQNGYNLSFGYDALSRQTSDGQGWGTISRQFDLAGRMTRTTWQDGFYVDYDRLVTGEPTKVRENGATSGVGVLATYGYDDLRRRTSVTYGNGAAQAFSYDAVSRLASLTNDLSGTANDLSVTFAYNPASQITQTARTGDPYAFSNANTNTTTVSNGLNQLSTVGGTSAAYDSKGNLTTDPTTAKTYSYSSENRMTAASGIPFYYDPLGRIAEYDTSVGNRFMSDGSEVVVEVDSPSANIVRRFVRGDGPDELIAWYEGSGTTTRRFAGLDERNSVISATDASGTLVGINSYDEYGRPSASNIGRFQYTGQMWLPEIGIQYSKARNYLPSAGVFAQTDPIGPEDDPNLYQYALNDPINLVDPFGINVVVTACRDPTMWWTGFSCLPRDPFGGLSDFFFHDLFNRARRDIENTVGGWLEPPARDHDYRTKDKVCRRNLSSKEAADLLSRFGVPNASAGYRQPAGLHLVSAGPVPGGFVHTTYAGNGLLVTNVTTPVHAFVGQITRQIYTSGGATFIGTHGWGSAGPGWFGNLRDSVNGLSGPAIFESLDAQAAAYARGHFSGC